jgi:hypothetical protein
MASTTMSPASAADERSRMVAGIAHPPRASPIPGIADHPPLITPIRFDGPMPSGRRSRSFF